MTSRGVLGLLLILGTLAVGHAWYLNVDTPLDNYPGDNGGFQRIGWGDDGYYRFTVNGARGYWTSNSWGAGMWKCEENCDSAATACPAGSYWWSGRGCISTGAPASKFASVATCGPCNVWSANGNVQMCTLSQGCGTVYGLGVSAVSVTTSGGGTAMIAGNGNGCAVSGNGGCMISGDGKSAAAAASSGGGTATAMSFAGGRRLKL
jgi:hypothetical protein